MSRWPLWQRIAFRFLAVYLVLYIAPWTWIGLLPFGLNGINTPWYGAMDWAVRAANAQLFHLRPALVAPNGSGDTSWAWAQFCLLLLVSVVATVVWSLADRKRTSYPRAAYWLRTLVRYKLAMELLSYGVIKVVPLQMPFPTLSQLATPIGDLVPMRLAWLFVGYSTPYQSFSGVVEMLAGLLLLWRRSVTLGVLVGVGAFINVLALNLAYDVPVKLFALHLFVMSLLLVAVDAPRLVRLFVINRPIGETHLYEPPAEGSRARVARYAVKAALLVCMVVLPAVDAGQLARDAARPRRAVPLSAGVYEVRTFVRNGDTIPATSTDTVRWRDVIIDDARGGSIGSTDTTFWQRYRRGYFRFKADTAARSMAIWRTSQIRDSTPLFTARYTLPDSNRAQLWFRQGRDSMYVELARTRRHFQLTERQFHWLSEYSR